MHPTAPTAARPIVALMPALFAAALGAAGLLFHASAVAEAAPLPTMNEALTLLREHRAAEAYGRLAVLADRGDPAAALLALAMLQHGPALWGSEWSATPGQLRRWTVLAAREARNLSLRSVAFERVE